VQVFQKKVVIELSLDPRPRKGKHFLRKSNLFLPRMTPEADYTACHPW